jgi:hypothetical protein
MAMIHAYACPCTCLTSTSPVALRIQAAKELGIEKSFCS